MKDEIIKYSINPREGRKDEKGKKKWKEEKGQLEKILW